VRSFKAAFKIFLINKIGDFFIIIFVANLIAVFGNLNFTLLNSQILILLNLQIFFLNVKISMLEFLGILLVLGGSVKSAQIG
jgi:NADH-quinone oxidoreductase subunit L